jgi:hypothetical protein
MNLAWQALPEFRRLDGDTTLISVKPNSVRYSTQVYDPLFLATSPDNDGAFTGLNTVYQPYYPVNIMGCIDQYTMCNPQTSKCSPPSALADLQRNYKALDMNERQSATALRIVVLLLNANTYSNTYATGDTALKASDKALGEVSTGLPDDQWITEIKGWFEIGLAKLQALTVQYVANTDNEAEIGFVGFPDIDDQLRQALLDQCASQKVKSGDGLQNLSLTGIIVVAVLGGVLLIIGLLFHPAILPATRRLVRNHVRPGRADEMTQHQRDYTADSKYHLYFMAVEDRNHPYEYQMRDGCPTFVTNPRLPNPGERASRVGEQATDRANVYRHTLASNAGANPQSSAPAPAAQTRSQGIQMSSLPPSGSQGSQQPLLSAGNPPPGSTSTASSHGTAAASTGNASGTSSGPAASSSNAALTQGSNTVALATVPQGSSSNTAAPGLTGSPPQVP